MTTGPGRPQDASDVGPTGLEAIVQALAEQAFAKQARDLSERVSLLEAKDEQKSDEDCGERPDDGTAARVSFARDDEESGRTRALTVDGKNISSRIRTIENRLDAYDDEKEVLVNHENTYTLSESTFSLLVTEDPCTVPFAFAFLSVALSISCLSLTLASSIMKGNEGNRIGIPGGVPDLVRAAQFLGECNIRKVVVCTTLKLSQAYSLDCLDSRQLLLGATVGEPRCIDLKLIHMHLVSLAYLIECTSTRCAYGG